MVIVDAMLPQLVLHEGLRLRVYQDTEGFDTVAVGYNLSARGPEFYQSVIGRRLDLHAAGDVTTRAEALEVCVRDIIRVEMAVTLHWPFYSQLDEVRQRVAVDMAFNMGFEALGFRQAKAAVERRDWSRAARELYKSKWAHQVGDGEGGKFDRCDRLARMLLTGQAPTDIPAAF